MRNIRRQADGRKARAVRSRGKMSGLDKPRLSVHRTNKYLFVQVIYPDGKSCFGTRGKDPAAVGEAVGKKARAAGVTKVVFDRGAYRYHGKVKLVAEAARKAGLVF